MKHDIPDPLSQVCVGCLGALCSYVEGITPALEQDPKTEINRVYHQFFIHRCELKRSDSCVERAAHDVRPPFQAYQSGSRALEVIHAVVLVTQQYANTGRK